jgi:hypothetical protein
MSADWDPGHRGLPEPGPDPDPDVDPDRRRGQESPHGDGELPDAGRIAWLIVGALAIAGGTALGWDATALASIVTPPPLVRAALIGLAVGVAIVLLVGALNRLAADPDDGRRPRAGDAGRANGRDIGTMIRGVRLVFLAVAALAAASGWMLGHPLPLVVALVIAGVDVLETSFLLIVVGLRSRG